MIISRKTRKKNIMKIVSNSNSSMAIDDKNKYKIKKKNYFSLLILFLKTKKTIVLP